MLSVENAESVPGAFAYMPNMATVSTRVRRVAEIRDPIHHRLLGKLDLDTGIMEIMSRGVLFNIDVKSMLLNNAAVPVPVAAPEICYQVEATSGT